SGVCNSGSAGRLLCRGRSKCARLSDRQICAAYHLCPQSVDRGNWFTGGRGGGDAGRLARYTRYPVTAACADLAEDRVNSRAGMHIELTIILVMPVRFMKLKTN